MGRRYSHYHNRRRPRISRAIGLLAILMVAIIMAPGASAMSPIAEIEPAALSSEETGTGVLLEDDISEKIREILEQEYNWWDLWSAPDNVAAASDQDIDSVFSHMEQYPAMYTRASAAAIEPGSDGSNTLSDYRSPVGNTATGRAIHPSLGEGFQSGVLEPNQGISRSDDRANLMARLAEEAASESDAATVENFQFIEQNTQLPAQEPAAGDGPPHTFGRSELNY
jgi:hypothetical protein